MKLWMILGLRVLLTCTDFVVSFGQELRQQRHVQLALTASSPFRMVLSRTDSELDPRALRLVEEVTATHLLDQSYTTTPNAVQGDVVKAIEIVIQVAEFQPDTSSTRIKFFALATFTALVDSASPSTDMSARQVELNALINRVLSSNNTTMDLYLQRLRESVIASNDAATTEQLALVQTVIVVPAAPATGTASGPSPSGSTANAVPEERPSSIDRVLIAVSSCILIGIAWMIFLYYKDLGYFASGSEHHDALNTTAGSFPNDAGSFPQLQYQDDDGEIDANAVDQSASTADIFLSQRDPPFGGNLIPLKIGDHALYDSSSMPYVRSHASSDHNSNKVATVPDSSASAVTASDESFPPDNFSYPQVHDEMGDAEVAAATAPAASGHGHVDDSGFPSITETSFLRDSPSPRIATANDFINGGSKDTDSLTEPFGTNVF